MKAYENWTSGRNMGLVFLIIMGLAFHELYKATGITILGIISPVNESKWEHWKMAFFPMMIIGSMEYFIFGLRGSNYIFSLMAGSAAFLLVTFGGIELYGMIVGEAHISVHVTTFLMGAAAGQFLRYHIMANTRESSAFLVLGIIVIGGLLAIFTLFTFSPPRYEYFRDSLTETYGIYENK